MFVRPGTHQRVKGLKAASLGWALALLANIKLGWKGQKLFLKRLIHQNYSSLLLKILIKNQ
jgi:hypothetical protein